MDPGASSSLAAAAAAHSVLAGLPGGEGHGYDDGYDDEEKEESAARGSPDAVPSTAYDGVGGYDTESFDDDDDDDDEEEEEDGDWDEGGGDDGDDLVAPRALPQFAVKSDVSVKLETVDTASGVDSRPSSVTKADAIWNQRINSSGGGVDLTVATKVPARRAPMPRGKGGGPGGKKGNQKAPSASSLRNEDTWNLRLDQLREYGIENGDYAVPQKYDPNPQLGYWVSKQRKEFANWVRGKPSCLTKQRMGALHAMGFPFPRPPSNPSPKLGTPVPKGPPGDVWMVRLDELRRYRAEKGNYQVPQKFEPNPQLGYWVSKQRKEFNNYVRGKPSTLNQARMRALFNIGFTWTLPKTGGASGVGSVSSATKTAPAERSGRQSPAASRSVPVDGSGGVLRSSRPEVAEPESDPAGTPEGARAGAGGGFAPAPSTFLPNGAAAGEAEGLLSTPSAAAAAFAAAIVLPPPARAASPPQPPPSRRKGGGAKAGMKTSSTSAASAAKQDVWNQRFEELRLYKEETGSCLVPQKYDKNMKLGKWVSQQRTQYRYWINGDASALTKERIRALKELGFAWNGRSATSSGEATSRGSGGGGGYKRARAAEGGSAPVQGSAVAPTAFVSPQSTGNLASAVLAHFSPDGAPPSSDMIQQLQNALEGGGEANGPSCGEKQKELEEERERHSEAESRCRLMEEEQNKLRKELEAAKAQLQEIRRENEAMQTKLSGVKESVTTLLSTMT